MRANFEALKGGTVLIVSDEPDLCLLKKVYFLRKGSRVFIAHTFGEALPSLARILPDAVVIFLASFDNAVIVESILQEAPEVQLISCNADVIYDKHRANG